ncbi:MAG: Rpn family recombination-promoting nuclease/putative transposase [Lachnospiraceae bacterium]|nr:Rpn family recombination-promoting nuclease/putative transposase [Lachnospiraceae bacterium]
MDNKTVTKLKDLNLVDRFLFDETMENREAYEAAVSILLENEVELLDRAETEKEFRISPKLREIRLDVVSMDSQKRIYYTEMQKKNTGNLKKRSRYYQAHIDVSLLEPGSMNFNLLNDSCFILIAPFDIFERGLCRYTFEGTCRECPDLKLGDGSIKVFINTKGRNREEFSEEFLDFMDYVTNSSAKVAGRTKSEKIKLIHRQVQKIKESEKMGVKYMQRWEELAEAKEEGGELMLIKQVCKKLGKGKSMEEIAEALEEDMEKIEKICEAAEGFAPDYNCEEIYEKLYEE